MGNIDHSVRLRNLGKMYRIFAKPSDRIKDAIGLLRFSRKSSVSMQEFWALRDINLDIKRGERVGIIGHNGAGKSTLLKLICGGVTPTEGQINVNGKIQALLELGTGFHPEFSGKENIRASLAYHGLTRDVIRALEEEIIDFAELDEFIDRPIKTYSAGMYARLAFSTATAIEPEILIIDEVLGAGDAYFAAKCTERMKRLTNDSGATVLFVSHDLGSMQSICERTIWMERGRIRMDGDPLEVSKSYYREVQRRENIRKVARSQGMRRNDAVVDDQQILMRFRTAELAAPQASNKIRSIRVLSDDETVLELKVGAPMDNDQDDRTHVMPSAGYMNWSEPRRDNKGFFRAFENCNGRYLHAPFKLDLPQHDRASYVLEIDHDLGEPVFLDIYRNEQYVPLGALDDTAPMTQMDLTALDTSPPPAGVTSDSDDKSVAQNESLSPSDTSDTTHGAGQESTSHNSVVDWKEPDPKIVEVNFLDADGKPVNGITEGEKLVVDIRYSATKRVVSPVFAMTFYLPDGKALVTANSKLARKSIREIEGDGNAYFVFDPFPAGPCELIISVSIFEYLDPKHFDGQQPFYDQHDRAYKFKVWSTLEHKMSYALINTSYRFEHENAVAIKDV